MALALMAAADERGVGLLAGMVATVAILMLSEWRRR